MALVLNGTNQYGQVAAAVKGAVPLTLVGWVKSSNVASARAFINVQNSASATIRNNFVALHNSSANLQASTGSASSQSAATSSGTITVNTWTQFICEFSATNARAAYINNGGSGTNTGSETPSGTNVTNIGARIASTSDLFLSGRLAALGVYGKQLSPGERAGLQTLAPIFVSPGDLLAYWPLLVDGLDPVGGFNLTLVNSPTFDTDNPPIIFSTFVSPPSRRERRFFGPVDPRLVE